MQILSKGDTAIIIFQNKLHKVFIQAYDEANKEYKVSDNISLFDSLVSLWVSEKYIAYDRTYDGLCKDCGADIEKLKKAIVKAVEQIKDMVGMDYADNDTFVDRKLRIILEILEV